MPQTSEYALPSRVCEWVIGAVHPGASIQSVRRLPGGTSSTVCGVSLRVGRRLQDVVLRLFDNAEWLKEEPDLALHEAESLRRAVGTGLPTPRLVAFDEAGTSCRLPAVLMTRLEGSVVLAADDRERWLDGMAEALARIHAVEADDCPWKHFAYMDLASLETPAWSNERDMWDAALAIVKGPRPEAKQVFIHRDYHPANVLWSGGRISGIVDWVNACRGPAGIDVGHCRLNLAQLHGVAAADRFLSAYRAHAGSAFDYDPYWDLLSLIDILFGPPKVYSGWKALGATGLTDEMMMERLDAYMLSLMARV